MCTIPSRTTVSRRGTGCRLDRSDELPTATRRCITWKYRIKSRLIEPLRPRGTDARLTAPIPYKPFPQLKRSFSSDGHERRSVVYIRAEILSLYAGNGFGARSIHNGNVETFVFCFSGRVEYTHPVRYGGAGFGRHSAVRPEPIPYTQSVVREAPSACAQNLTRTKRYLRR